MGNMCFPQEINSSSFVSMTLIILSAKQNFSMHNIKCDIGTQHVRMHTHTHIHRHNYIYIYLHPLTCFALLSGGALIAPAAPPGAGSRMIMNISVSRANTHTLSLRRSPSPSLPLSLPSPLLSSALALYVLSVIKLPLPPQKKVSLDRFLFLNSEKCVKNSVPFTQWLQLSLCPGKHKRS